jgi:predicted  nucleic acid-binding Zn-ribbon protein
MPRTWKIKNGKVVVETAAIEATSREVSTEQLDRRIQQLRRERAHAEDELAQVQARLDKLTQQESELVALRAQL